MIAYNELRGCPGGYSGKEKDCWQEVALGLCRIAELSVRKEFG